VAACTSIQKEEQFGLMPRAPRLLSWSGCKVCFACRWSDRYMFAPQ